MRKETLVTHPGIITTPTDNPPFVQPIYQSVKFHFSSLEELENARVGKREGYFYSRVANPTLRQLELLLAKLQDRDDALVTNTGVSAIALCLLSFLAKDDHVVTFVQSYTPIRFLIRKLLGKFGVTCTLADVRDIESLERAIVPGRTKMIIIESPTNPTTRICDLDRVLAIAKKHQVITVLDNTFAGFHNHGKYAFDLYLHSLTKFASGHGDVMGGAVIGSKSLLDSMRSNYAHLGPALDPHAAFLIARGMNSYFVRYEKQCENALKIANFLAERKQVIRLLYPGLPSHPDHALAKRQMSDFGSIITLDLDGGKAQLRTFLDSLKLFSVSFSLGSTESLAAPAKLFYAGDLSEAEQQIAEITPATVRLSIGLESVDDLNADLEQALEKI